MATIAPVDPNADPTKKKVDPNAPAAPVLGAQTNYTASGGSTYSDPGAMAGGNMDKGGATVPTGARTLGGQTDYTLQGPASSGDQGGAPAGDPRPQSDPSKLGATTSPVTPPAPAAPVRNNFSWGVHGVGTEGVDWGNTNNWNDQQWQEYEARYAPQTPAATTPAPATPGAGVTGPANPGPQAPAGPDLQTTYQQALIDRLTPKEANVNDAAIRPAIQANQYAEQRNMESARALAAENAARGGGQGANSGDFETTLLGLQQDKAAREGQYAGGAVQHLQDMYNDNATSALGQAGQQLTAQQQMALQRQLAGDQLALQRELGQGDLNIRGESVAQQGRLGQGDLALRGELGRGQLNLGLLGLLQGGDQFTRQLNQNRDQFGANLDQNGILGLLGML